MMHISPREQMWWRAKKAGHSYEQIATRFGAHKDDVRDGIWHIAKQMIAEWQAKRKSSPHKPIKPSTKEKTVPKTLEQRFIAAGWVRQDSEHWRNDQRKLSLFRYSGSWLVGVHGSSKTTKAGKTLKKAMTELLETGETKAVCQK